MLGFASDRSVLPRATRRCRHCGFRSAVAASFRVERGGVFGRPRPICFGCAPDEPSELERQGIRWWVGRLVIWGLIGLWVGRDWGYDFVVLAWLALALNEPLNTAVHEAGHAIAARLMGFSLLSVRVGRGPEILHARWGPARLGLRRYAVLGGQTRYIPPSDAARWRRIVVFLAGPFANLLAACVLIALGVVLDGRSDPWARAGTAVVFGLLISHLRTVVDTLWPRALSEGGMTDGGQALAAARGAQPSPPAGDERFQLLVAVERLKQTARYAEAADLVADDLGAWMNDPFLLGMVIHYTSRAAGDRAAIARYDALVAQAPAGPPRPLGGHGEAVGWLAANIAWSTIKSGPEADLEEADHQLQIALERLPDANEVKATLGALYVARGETELGERLLTQALHVLGDPLDRADFTAWIERARRDRGDAAGAAEAGRLRAHILDRMLEPDD
jgi:hypothetical protein